MRSAVCRLLVHALFCGTRCPVLMCSTALRRDPRSETIIDTTIGRRLGQSVI